MTNTEEIEQKLGEITEKLEELPEPRELTEIERKKLEALTEERLLQRMAFFKRLREQ
nr:9082_t:CDS:2 [Entrophospora candida]